MEMSGSYNLWVFNKHKIFLFLLLRCRFSFNGEEHFSAIFPFYFTEIDISHSPGKSG
jgi:hypothetical protein